MSPELDALKTRVTAMTTVAGSAATLIQGLADRIRAGANDSQAMLDLANELDGDATTLGNAVAANATP